MNPAFHASPDPTATGAPVSDAYIVEFGSSPESDPPTEFVFLNTEGGEFAVCGACCDKRRFADLAPEEIAHVEEQIRALREESGA